MNFFRGNRQVREPYAHRVIDRVGDCRRDRDVAHLADSLAAVRRRAGLVLDEHGRELRNIHGGRELVVTEMGSYYGAVADDEIFRQGLADSLHDATLDLSLL